MYYQGMATPLTYINTSSFFNDFIERENEIKDTQDGEYVLFEIKLKYRVEKYIERYILAHASQISCNFSFGAYNEMNPYSLVSSSGTVEIFDYEESFKRNFKFDMAYIESVKHFQTKEDAELFIQLSQ